MSTITALIALLFFPAGWSFCWRGWRTTGPTASWPRQNRIGPRWFQPLADNLKLLAKEGFRWACIAGCSSRCR